MTPNYGTKLEDIMILIKKIDMIQVDSNAANVYSFIYGEVMLKQFNLTLR